MPFLTEERMSGDKAYGILFCVTGREEMVARNLREYYGEGCRTLTARMMKRRTQKGRTMEVQQVMFPGYVFVEMDGAEMHHVVSPKSDGLISMLRASDGDWRLYGEDEAFVKWLFAQDGLLAFSKAYQEGDRVRIISGPLKDLEGSIAKVDRRNRSGQVSLRVAGREVKVWLGFELVGKPMEI